MNPLQQLFEKRATDIFLDSGDPTETALTIEMLGFLDGQTTNPSLIAKSPSIQEYLKTKKFTRDELFEKYREIVLQIESIIPNGKISAEVYADANSTADELLKQAYEISKWFPGIFVKLPITNVGLAAAEKLVSEGISVNMTLCFSQEQAAAVHAATKNAKDAHVYVSPFVGRLDDINLRGVDLIKNIQKMYLGWNSHVRVLGASIRSTDHVNLCMDEKISAMTIPFKLMKEINEKSIIPTEQPYLEPIQYQELTELPWNEYDINHELTSKGLEKFAADWNALCE